MRRRHTGALRLLTALSLATLWQVGASCAAQDDPGICAALLEAYVAWGNMPAAWTEGIQSGQSYCNWAQPAWAAKIAAGAAAPAPAIAESSSTNTYSSTTSTAYSSSTATLTATAPVAPTGAGHLGCNAQGDIELMCAFSERRTQTFPKMCLPYLPMIN